MTDEQKPMTKTEREELKRLARERARVAKLDADARAADLKALFEMQMIEHYDYDTVENWQKGEEAVREVVEAAEQQIRERFDAIGIPSAMAPELGVHWHSRGRHVVVYEQSELRRAAHKRIDAMTRAARHEIDRKALQVQTELVAAGLTSDRAIEFLHSMPQVDALMPALDVGEMFAKVSPREIGQGDDDIAF